MAPDPDRMARFDDELRSGTHLWTTLGYRRLGWGEGTTSIAWDATPEYGFPTAGGPVIQGGLVTAILDAAMGGACWTVLDADSAFLTADLRVEFLRSTRPGTVTGHGHRRTTDAPGRLLRGAAGRRGGGAARREPVHPGGPAGRRPGRSLRRAGRGRVAAAGRARLSDLSHKR